MYMSVHEGVVKLHDADGLFLILPAMLTSAATRLLAHPAPLLKGLMCGGMSFDVSLWRQHW